MTPIILYKQDFVGLKMVSYNYKENLPPETAKDINEGLLTNIKTSFETRLVNILYGPL